MITIGNPKDGLPHKHCCVLIKQSSLWWTMNTLKISIPTYSWRGSLPRWPGWVTAVANGKQGMLVGLIIVEVLREVWIKCIFSTLGCWYTCMVSSPCKGSHYKKLMVFFFIFLLSLSMWLVKIVEIVANLTHTRNKSLRPQEVLIDTPLPFQGGSWRRRDSASIQVLRDLPFCRHGLDKFEACVHVRMKVLPNH